MYLTYAIDIGVHMRYIYDILMQYICNVIEFKIKDKGWIHRFSQLADF